MEIPIFYKDLFPVPGPVKKPRKITSLSSHSLAIFFILSYNMNMSSQALYKRLRALGIVCERRGDYVLILPEPMVLAQSNAFQFDEVTGEPSPNGRIVFVARRHEPFVVPVLGGPPRICNSARESVELFAQNYPPQWLVNRRFRESAFRNDGATVLSQLRHKLHLIGKGGTEVVYNPIKLLELQEIDFVYQYGIVNASSLNTCVFHNIRNPRLDEFYILYTMFYVPKALFTREHVSSEALHNCIWKEDESFYYILASLNNRVKRPNRQETYRRLCEVFFDLPYDDPSLLASPGELNENLISAIKALPNSSKRGFMPDVLYNVFAPAFCPDPFGFGRWII